MTYMSTALEGPCSNSARLLGQLQTLLQAVQSSVQMCVNFLTSHSTIDLALAFLGAMANNITDKQQLIQTRPQVHVQNQCTTPIS